MTYGVARQLAALQSAREGRDVFLAKVTADEDQRFVIERRSGDPLQITLGAGLIMRDAAGDAAHVDEQAERDEDVEVGGSLIDLRSREIEAIRCSKSAVAQHLPRLMGQETEVVHACTP